MATTLARATGATREEALQTMRDAGIKNVEMGKKPKKEAAAPSERQQKIITDLGNLKEQPISMLAAAIRKDWSDSEKGVFYGAKPYLSAMMGISSIEQKYIADDAKEVVVRFLSNASQWKGPVARVVKKELNRRLKSGRDPEAPAETPEERYIRIMSTT